jgi:cell division septum initiation protein DivIVA
MLDRSTADALSAAKTEPAAVEFEGSLYVDRQRVIDEAQAMARNILAEAERAAQDIVARAVKIKAEADRALDDAKSKAACIQKRAQAALALAESIAKGRHLIDTFGG